MTLFYPQLTDEEQARLPGLVAAPVPLNTLYNDSSHQLWLCDTTSGLLVLKRCRHEAIAQSTFWFGMNHLFDIDFPSSLSQAAKIFQTVRRCGTLLIPELVQAQQNRFVLTHYLNGDDVTAETVDEASVVMLGHHIQQCHQHRQARWGDMVSPHFDAASWPSRCRSTLLQLIARQEQVIPETLLQDVLQRLDRIVETDFVPVMPDLRWDQFRRLPDQQLALIDLDAFVLAPPAFELVLLEYVLTTAQFALFKTIYTEQHPWPDYELQRPCYQLLLFLMHVLGDTDLESWMQHKNKR